jgi:hypothetical protein
MSKQSRLKNILQAISLWLNFEKICHKENLFNEKYLSYPIGQFLQSRFTKGVHPQYPHPLLNPKRVGSKPKIDFVVKETRDGNESMKIAIETKWLSGSRTLLKDCIRDVLRLAVLAELDNNTACYFIVCGRYSDWLTKIENNSNFYYVKRNGRRVYLLNLGIPGHNNICPLSPHKKFDKIMSSALSDLNLKVGLPEKIRITHYGKFPNQPKRSEYIAIGWKIRTYKHSPDSDRK